ncbi:MAG: hypothetical protein ACKO0V_20310, partial [bacterium]
TVRDLNWRQIQPDGSNWHELFDHLQKSSENIIYLNDKLQNHLDYFILPMARHQPFVMIIR